ncbi:TenA family protein [Granulicoccus sp. GXG6511]|uniref:TenA family protein n=1 Tax=Granulicoccus sp. GXG6511 TaxID=3381351 RepID=UPI003D7C91A4
MFTDHAWNDIRPILTAIETHPFVIGLGDGSLDSDKYAYYMAQDALYLADYGRVLALAAAQAPSVTELQFWADSATATAVTERELHARYVADFDNVEPSPTCTAYTSFLANCATRGSYALVAAAVLPCFWIYDHIGRRLLDALDHGEHPYAGWIQTYADPAFNEASRRAQELTNAAVDPLPLEHQQQALRAFRTAARYEYMFWDAAWRQETWPV